MVDEKTVEENLKEGLSPDGLPLTDDQVRVAAEVDTIQTELELETSKWIHRRRMAYVCLGAILVIILGSFMLAIYRPDVVDSIMKISEILNWGIGALASVVGAYVGFATWYDIKKGGNTQG